MQKINWKALRAFCLVLSFMFILSACAGGSNSEPEAPTSSDSGESGIVAEQEAETRTPGGPQSLLTNELIDGKDLSMVRPLGVMIENTKAALPHYGLSEAGIVYEAPEEGGITRYLAVYDQYEDFKRLGNIRSTRPYYCLVASEYEMVLAHIGQSIYAEGLLKSYNQSSLVMDVNGVLGNSSFFRASDKAAPHNAYLSSESILKDIANNGYTTEYLEPRVSNFKFAEGENLLDEGKACTEAHLYYLNNKPYFTYDADTKLYTRYEFGALEKDALSEDGSITFTNIILQNCTSAEHANDPYIDLNVTGKGKGWFLTRGKMVDITWEKPYDSSITVFYMPDGSEIELNTGKTYVGLLQSSYEDSNTFK